MSKEKEPEKESDRMIKLKKLAILCGRIRDEELRWDAGEIVEELIKEEKENEQFLPTESDYKWLEKHCIKGNGLWLYESGRGCLVHDVGVVLNEDGWVAGSFYGESDSYDDLEPIVTAKTPKKAVAHVIEHEIAVLEGRVVELSDAMMELEGKE